MKLAPAMFALALAGCVADESAQKAARDAYADCTMAAVARLDDGRSDPASVAMGVAGACAAPYAALTNQVQGGYVTAAGRASARDTMQTNELRMATNAVLTYRAAKRSN